MEAIIKESANVLIPNKEHKNFTQTDEIIEKGTVVNGNFRNVEGKRRGQDFTYKLFITDNNKILYQKLVEPMRTTEVTLGADSEVTATQVNLKPAEKFSKLKVTGAVVGATIGYLYARRKKFAGKKIALPIILGAIAGYGAGYFIDSKRDVMVTPSK